jgi:hypothetical protein
MSSQSVDQQTMHMVLVHGAWADGSGWAKVIEPLAAEGFAVTALQVIHEAVTTVAAA